ncbi:MAG TPA: DNA topoisomerase IV subunit A [Phycisphaerales bacterium]|nr:DNA topoisomerase IV subunit A [Phycisphaerales bacterium]HMP35822.1 DNA topoisomerase IV subunit A [Phycisphaerales bacterium]
MARKRTAPTSSTPAPAAGSGGARSGARATDAATQKKIASLAAAVEKVSLAEKDPYVDIPVRALSNTKWNKSRRILQMGESQQRRNLFNLGQARKFMQTLLISNGCRELIDQGKTTSLRGMFYKSLHTISGTKEKTFADQDESDPIIEDLEVALGALREELHLFAKEAGKVVGNLTIIDSGDEIDLRRMGTGGYAIPSIVEPSVIRFGKCDAKFVLHVEKGTVWARFNEDRFWQKHNCILTEGGGQPPRGVRRLLRRLHDELGLPIYCLLDCDPWGHYIYSVIKQGSISLAFESERMAVPDAKFIGIRAGDYRRYDLSDDVEIALNDRDVARAKQIAAYPWFKDRRDWQKEIDQMLRNGFKMEVESLITKGISFVTEEYVPQKLAAKDWLD